MKGQDFEQLVTWINTCLHQNAVVSSNESLPDIDTGSKRQIDVCIRLKDGPTEILGIVEARDRSRQVGVGYIEEVNSKRESVGEDFAVIVSNKGFGNPARQKAKRYGIRLFTLAEALKFNWSKTIDQLKVIEQLFNTESMVIRFHKKEDNSIIVPDESVLAQLEKNQNSLILETEGGLPLAPMQSLSRAFQQVVENWLQPGKENGQHFRIYFEIKSIPVLFIKNSEGSRNIVDYISFDSFCWLEHLQITPVINQYKNSFTGDVVAEVISVQSTKTDEKIDFTIEQPNNIQHDRKVGVRSDKNIEQTKAQAEMQFWFTLKKAFIKNGENFYQINVQTKQAGIKG